MSARTQYPRARESDSHYYLSISRGGRHKRIALSPGMALGLAAALPAIAALYLGATAYLFFRDDVISGLMARQAKLQYSYEDRLAAMRSQLDKVTSRQLLDQDSFEGKVQGLINRQAQLETRTALVASLTERIGAAPLTASPTPAKTPVRPGQASNSASGGPFTPAPAPDGEKPRPDGFELRAGADGEQRTIVLPAPSARAAEADADMPAPMRLESVALSLDQIEHRQVQALAALSAPAAAKVERLKTAFSEIGLPIDKIAPEQKASAMGGPYAPASAQASAFDRAFASVQNSFISLDRIKRALPRIPIRRPLAGSLDITSTFGYRVDPFLGKGALHSGLDMRAETGTPVMATAAGTVVTAAHTGGYGNLVEIDHGHGVATRYGHLSAINVTEGQSVSAGSVVGKVGSTGRSTGPHLHYEVRLREEATDPSRFIKAARLLSPQD